MLRLCQIGDPHVTEGPRFEDTLKCLYAAADDGRAQSVQLWAVPGDFSGTTVPHKQSTAERNALDDWLRYLAETAPVVTCAGNHDAPGDCERFGKLKAPHRIFWCDAPTVLELDDLGAVVFVLPYQHKRFWLAPHADLPIEAQDRAVERDLRGLLGGWADRLDAARAAGRTTLAFGHLAVENVALAGGERLLPPGQEIALSFHDLALLDVDFGGLGHIHLRQQLTPKWWMSGTPDRSNFGEESDEKGWLIADARPGMPPTVHVRMSPARRYVTLRAAWTETADGWAWVWDGRSPDDVPTDAEVRVLVTMPEEAAATAPVDALRADLLAAGAHGVALERRHLPKRGARADALATATTDEEMLVACWESWPEADRPTEAQRARCLAKLATLKERIAA